MPLIGTFAAASAGGFGRRTGKRDLFIVASGGNSTLTDGDFKIHVFTGPGTFTVNQAGTGPTDNTDVDYLVVGGGGGGGDEYGGGGGAGGVRASDASYTGPPAASNTGITVNATGYPITVGAGGAGGPGAGQVGSNSAAFPTNASTC